MIALRSSRVARGREWECPRPSCGSRIARSDYLLDRLAWPGPLWLITGPGREHPAGWQRFDREMVKSVAGLGPLRGVLTALEHLDGPELIVTTIDMPAITAAALRWSH